MVSSEWCSGRPQRCRAPRGAALQWTTIALSRWTIRCRLIDCSNVILILCYWIRIQIWTLYNVVELSKKIKLLLYFFFCYIQPDFNFKDTNEHIVMNFIKTILLDIFTRTRNVIVLGLNGIPHLLSHTMGKFCSLGKYNNVTCIVFA